MHKIMFEILKYPDLKKDERMAVNPEYCKIVVECALEGSSDKRYFQHFFVGRVRAMLEALCEFKCEASIEIVVQKGDVFLGGAIGAYTLATLNAIERLFKDTLETLYLFTQQNPKSCFLVSYIQKLEVAPVIES